LFGESERGASEGLERRKIGAGEGLRKDWRKIEERLEKLGEITAEKLLLLMGAIAGINSSRCGYSQRVCEML